ncbi:hypothetical protein P154DRAFT_27864 [Amniculicola lignicola CBS 123094]|uniref:BZIP domain-containing protein n=1 Tax=Amniculicola lignicola CBS 123094 TaxID=1392246 RepID=A0A6A5W021_9PLEO|nr:hypothetical protein P154DRAFT_27864 [Amniculicola lignicola CBS 123094]
MSDQENSSLAGVPQKRTLSAQRRLQNRVAQQRYRERQKTNAATSAEQSDVTPPNGHDAGGTVDAVDAGDGEDMYYQREHAFLPNSDHPLSSSLGLNHTPIQWHAPPIPSVAPSPQIPHPFDAALDNGLNGHRVSSPILPAASISISRIKRQRLDSASTAIFQRNVHYTKPFFSICLPIIPLPRQLYKQHGPIIRNTTFRHVLQDFAIENPAPTRRDPHPQKINGAVVTAPRRVEHQRARHGRPHSTPCRRASRRRRNGRDAYKARGESGDAR